MKTGRPVVHGAVTALFVVASAAAIASDPAIAIEVSQVQLSDEPVVPGRDALGDELDSLQQQIENEFALDRETLESRQKVTELLRSADAAVQSGDLEKAATILREAEQTALPRDPATRNRVLFAKVNLEIRRGDLAAARALLDVVASSSDLSQTQKERISALEARLRSAVTSAERDAIIAEITSLPDVTAIERAREEAENDPENFSVRLLLGDLLRKAGRLAEAQVVAENLIRDTEGADEVANRQRAFVLAARIAVDRKDFAKAREYTELLRTSPETAQKEDRISRLVEVIERGETRAAETAEQVARRQAVQQILTLTGARAISKAREVVSGDPENFDARLLLGDLLRKAGKLADSRAVAESLIGVTDSAERVGYRQRTIILLGRIAVDRDDYRLARSYLDALRMTPETPQKSARIGDLERRIVYEEKRRAERLASEASKRREAAVRAAEKAREDAQKARIDAELAAIERLPPMEAITRAKALYDVNRGNPSIGNAYARLLAREWRDLEAEAVYLEVLNANVGTDLTKLSSVVFGLVDLYSRTNRLAAANSLLKRLDEAYQAAGMSPADRAIVLRARIDEALVPNQLSGSLTLSGGYNSNVSTSLDENGPDDLLRTDAGSAFLESDLRLRYDRVLSDNGDRFRAQVRLTGRPYLQVDNADRLSAEVNAGFVHPLPGTRTTVTALAGYRSRFVDYRSYRRTAYGLLNVETDFSRRFEGSSTFIIESNDDENNDRDGYAVDGNWRVTFRPTDMWRAGIALDARYEDARRDSEGRITVGPIVNVRGSFKIGEVPGYFVTGSYSPSFTTYNAPLENGPDAGVTRRDLTHRLALTLGRDFSPEWRASFGIVYAARDSNIAAKSEDATQVMFSITRTFDVR